MECHVCLERFDAGERRPKCLPCGHTFCLGCLLGVQARCPLDNKLFESQPQDLPDNFLVLQFVTSPAEPAAPRVWCRTCDAVPVALERCAVDGHAFCSLQKARSGDAEPLLEALRLDEAGVAKLGETLDSAARDLDLQAGRPQLEEAKASLAADRARLQDAVGANDAVWEQAKQAVGQGGLFRSAAKLSADLVDPSSECSLTVQSNGEAAWRGEVRPAEDAAARLLLCQLACRGALQPLDQHHGEQGPAAPRWQERRNELDGELTVEEMAARMSRGSRVARGRDWDPMATHDGTPPGPGTVTLIRDGRVTVKWDCSPGTPLTNSMGDKGIYRVRLLRNPPEPYMGMRGKVLDAASTNTNSDENKVEKMMEAAEIILADKSTSTDARIVDAIKSNNLLEVRTLVGLNCEASPTGSLFLLQQVAPHLVGLQMVAPQRQHLDAALAMPQLEELSLTSVAAEQLRQVTHIMTHMVSLRCLELHCTFGAPLPVLAFPPMRLDMLRCGVYPLAAALALVRANAETLEELQLVAASEEPYGCPDLAAELRRCGLKKLRKLVLLRETTYGDFCRHDKVSCRRQMIKLFSLLEDIGFGDSCVSCSACYEDICFMESDSF